MSAVLKPEYEAGRILTMKAEAMPQQLEVPEEIAAKAQVFIEGYEKFLKARTAAYVERMAEAKPEAGEPTLASGYQYWNCLTVGPIQFFGNPPYRPSKIIAAGELALMLGVVWANPVNSDGGGLPGTIVLGGRDYRVRFETINLTSVANGPDATFAGTFAPVAPVVSIFPWFFIPGDPGVNPNLYETSLTADITNVGQPFAAFGTWHLDLDTEPGFLGRPPVGPQWQYDMPARYLVYRK